MVLLAVLAVLAATVVAAVVVVVVVVVVVLQPASGPAALRDCAPAAVAHLTGRCQLTARVR